MPVERSAGAIIARETPKGRMYLLLQHPPGKYSRNQSQKKKGGHWDFPKGHIEKGERTEDTVRREVIEESGISNIEFAPGFKETIKYFVGPKGDRRLKFVAFFLAFSKQRRITISHEHMGFKWLAFEKAYKLATYPETKRLLKKADDFLKKSP